MSLNEQQFKVVNHDEGPLLVLACPGSGKTRCVTERIARLVRTGTDTHRILGVTFTNKAANEMKERLRRMGFEGILLCTFHSLGVRILRKCGKLLGYKSNFTIIDQSGQLSFLRKIVKEQGLDPKQPQFDPKRIVKFLEHKKNQLISDEKFELLLEPELITIFRKYAKMLKAANSMDFSDLIYNVVMLFEKNPKVKEAYANKYKYVLVDEMQDTNKAQLEMVKHLSSIHKNIMCVADNRQSIYGWRGACQENTLKFSEHFDGAETVMLGMSYRCTQEILDVAQNLIRKNVNSKKTVLVASRGSGDKVEFLQHSTPELEAEDIASLINAHHYDGTSFKEIAVLCRTNSLTRVLEETFRRRNVPYVLIGSFGFYDRKEVRTALSFMKFLANSEDILSFEEIINTPSRGVGQVTLLKIIDHAVENDLGFLEVCKDIDNVKKINGKVKSSIKHFVNVLEMYDSKNPSETLGEIFEECGFLESLRMTDKARDEHREDNVNELLRAFSNYAGRQANPTISKYLQEIMLMSSADKEVVTESVSLMTCHASKGLEFDVVFVPGMEEDIFPHKRSISEGCVEEERRVCYVAATRARDRLYFSMSAIRNATGNMPSRFLEDMGLIEIDWSQVGEI